MSRRIELISVEEIYYALDKDPPASWVSASMEKFVDPRHPPTETRTLSEDVLLKPIQESEVLGRRSDSL